MSETIKNRFGGQLVVDPSGDGYREINTEQSTGVFTLPNSDTEWVSFLSDLIGRKVAAVIYEDDATDQVLAEVGAECATHAGRGYDHKHDDWHTVHELVKFAGTYGHRGCRNDERADLVKAASLMVAAIKRFDRAALARDAAAKERERAEEEWRYTGEFGWGPWQAGEGPDFEGQVLDSASSDLSKALDGQP